MPITQKEIIESELEIGVWEITETEAELTDGLVLSPEAQCDFLNVKVKCIERAI